jgi:hypothetical protein
VSDLAARRERIREERVWQPSSSIAEACERIERLTGIRRQPGQGLEFLRGMRPKFPCVRAVPALPKESRPAREGASQVPGRESRPALEEAKEGKRHVVFVGATQCVSVAFLCWLWLFTRKFVRAASGRPRFDVLGAFNADFRRPSNLPE